MKPALTLIVGLLAAGAVHAFSADEERAERARIQTERAQAESLYAQRERECKQRFIVTRCIDDARRERRQTLERLRQQQEVLDAADRKQRAAQRMEDIQSRLGNEDARRREATPREERPAPAATVREPRQAASAASTPMPLPTRRLSEQEKDRNEAAYEKRRQQAIEHREAVARRNALRASNGKAPAKPLPVPGAASASSSSR